MNKRSKNKKQPQLQLKCPRCDCRHLCLLSTRKTKSGTLATKRQCRHCGRIITVCE